LNLYLKIRIKTGTLNSEIIEIKLSDPTARGKSMNQLFAEKKTALYDVIVAGHICLDIIPTIPPSGETSIAGIFLPGKLINVGDAAVSTGGPVSNTGIALKKMGLKVAFMAKVGQDDFGELIMKRLATAGNADGILLSVEESSSYTVALAPPGIDRIFLHHPGTNNTFSCQDVNFEMVPRTRIFHLGYPPLMRRLYENDGAELIEIFQQVKSAGITTSLDLSLPDLNSPSGQVNWLRLLEQVVPYVDILLPSIEEAFFMLEKNAYLQLKQQAGGKEILDFIEPEIYSRLAGRLLDLGAKIVALKTAHRGFYLRTAAANRLQDMGNTPPTDIQNWANREVWCPAFHVAKIGSATGSGDSSIAGFYAGYLRGFSLEKTLKFANCLGFQNLHALDALSGIRTWDETREMVAAKKLPLIDAKIQSPDWNWDAVSEVWLGPNN
jgi:sugar/nucleoside kinase (ribokinase family)